MRPGAGVLALLIALSFWFIIAGIGFILRGSVEVMAAFYMRRLAS